MARREDGRSDVARLGLAVKRPGEADFEFVDYYDAQPAGSLHTPWKDMAGGETRFRVTAVAGDNSVLETAEVAKTIEGMTAMGSLVPNFGEQTVGVTGETKRVRLEGWDHVYFMPLLVRGITTSSEEFKVVREDCTGRAVRLDGCHIDITFTPAELGARTARLQLDANSFGKELDLRGVGIAPVPDPPLAIPEPTPAPAPTQIVRSPHSPSTPLRAARARSCSGCGSSTCRPEARSPFAARRAARRRPTPSAAPAGPCRSPASRRAG